MVVDFLLNSCNIPIALIDPDFGEQTTQACANACSRQLTLTRATSPRAPSPAPSAYLLHYYSTGSAPATSCSCRSPTVSAQPLCMLRPGYHSHSTNPETPARPT